MYLSWNTYSKLKILFCQNMFIDLLKCCVRISKLFLWPTIGEIKTVEVVKNGKVGNPDAYKTEVKCEKKDKFDKDGCGAVLAVTAQDLIMMYWHGTHFRHNYTAVRCPQCGKYNRVRDVPPLVWEKFNTVKNREKAIFDGFSESIY